MAKKIVRLQKKQSNLLCWIAVVIIFFGIPTTVAVYLNFSTRPTTVLKQRSVASSDVWYEQSFCKKYKLAEAECLDALRIPSLILNLMDLAEKYSYDPTGLDGELKPHKNYFVFNFILAHSAGSCRFIPHPSISPS